MDLAGRWLVSPLLQVVSCPSRTGIFLLLKPPGRELWLRQPPANVNPPNSMVPVWKANSPILNNTSNVFQMYLGWAILEMPYLAPKCIGTGRGFVLLLEEHCSKNGVFIPAHMGGHISGLSKSAQPQFYHYVWWKAHKYIYQVWASYSGKPMFATEHAPIRESWQGFNSTNWLAKKYIKKINLQNILSVSWLISFF